MLTSLRNLFRQTDSGEDVTLAPLATNYTRSVAPRAFVVDDEEGICKLIAMTLATMGVASEKFHTAPEAVAALDKGLPAIIFLDVALKQSDAIDVIRGLGERGYHGIVQLMSGSNVELLEDVRRIGTRHGLNMRPPLTKPFRAESIRDIGRVVLSRALAPDRPIQSAQPRAAFFFNPLYIARCRGKPLLLIRIVGREAGDGAPWMAASWQEPARRVIGGGNE